MHRLVPSSPLLRLQCLLALTVVTLLLAGCVTPPQPEQTGPTAAELARVAKQERVDRATANLGEGVKAYEAGNYEPAMTSFLVALDSGVLSVPQQLVARKLMAFIHCVSSRETNCREEFEKALALDSKFDLTPAESGHPIWGAVFRNMKSEIEARKSGRTPVAAVPKVLTTGERLLASGMTAYDAGEYANAIKLLQDASRETLSTDDQIRARKFSAFSLCLTGKMVACRQEFEAILKIKSDFDLAPAEAGHPSWGPTFRSAKARAKAAPPPKK
jgi:hypothetical protein